MVIQIPVGQINLNKNLSKCPIFALFTALTLLIESPGAIAEQLLIKDVSTMSDKVASMQNGSPRLQTTSKGR